MKHTILATSFVVGVLASASLMAMEAPVSASPPTDVRTAASDSVLKVGDAPLLLAAGDGWEVRSERLQKPLSPKTLKAMPQREVRDTTPWWR